MIAAVGIIAAFILFVWRQVLLFQSPDEALLQIVDGALTVDVYSLAHLDRSGALFGWLIYEVID
jgi:hypothetical protein